MAPRIVNRVPGDVLVPFSPGRPVQLGLRSEAAKVKLSSLNVGIGFGADIFVPTVLPEDNTSLAQKNIEVTVDSVERYRPLSGSEALRTAIGDTVVITKVDRGAGEKSVYEISMPVNGRPSVVASLAFKKKAWDPVTDFWCNLTDMAAPYFGFEYGPMNTGVFVGLRKSGAGTVVIGGPLQASSQPRPEQEEVAFPWDGLPADEVIEFFLVFNQVGFPQPYVPANTPVVEVWARAATAPTPLKLFSKPIGSLGTFPTSSGGSPNYRPGSSDTIRFFFGNAGAAGNVVELTDFAMYPHYTLPMLGGAGVAGSDVQVLPEAPLVYRARSNLRPSETNPARWIENEYETSSLFSYQPGRRSTPSHLLLPKTVLDENPMYSRAEPRVAVSPGFMMEAVIAGDVETMDFEAAGMGFGIDDGTNRYLLSLLKNDNRIGFGMLANSTLANRFEGHLVPPDFELDFRGLRHLRFDYTRANSELVMYAESMEVLRTQIPPVMPPSLTGIPNAFFGHLPGMHSIGRMSVAGVNLVPSWVGWEGSTNALPDASALFNQLGRLTASMVNGRVHITEGGYIKEDPFYEHGGCYVEFKTKVEEQAGHYGLRLFFGNKYLDLGFYDCGIHGKKVGFLTSTVTEADILGQTEAGRKVSASVDYENDTIYRVVVRAFDRIELYIGWLSILMNEPAITMLWNRDSWGFDLPLDAVTNPGLAFGFITGTGDASASFIRWGLSSGYDVGMMPNTIISPDVFGGRMLVNADFEEE